MLKRVGGYTQLINNGAGLLVTGVSEINGGCGAGFDRNRLGKWAETLVPGLKRVGSRRDFIDLKRAVGIGNREIWIRHHTDICVHPIVNIALEMKHDLFVFRFPLVDEARCWLADVEAVVLAGQAVNIVQERITVSALYNLSDTKANNARRVNATALVD